MEPCGRNGWYVRGYGMIEELAQHCANNSEYSTCYLHQYCVVVSQQCHRIASFLRLALSQISGTVFHCYLGNAVLGKVCGIISVKDIQ